MKQVINPIESSVLQDIVNLYLDDLKSDQHASEHTCCIACARTAIVEAISNYRSLDNVLENASTGVD